MLNRLAITFEEDYVQVLSEGDKDFAFASDLWRQVTETCKKHDCFNVLGIANTSTPVEAMEGYDHGTLFRDLDINRNYRIAWVELNPDAVDMAHFIESVLVNRGLPGRLFSNEPEAKEWLLKDSSP